MGNWRKKNIVKRIYHFITGESKKYDYFATSSPLMDKVYCSSLKYRGSSIEKMLQCGIPRNDYLIDNKDNQEEILRIKDKYSKLLGFDKNKKNCAIRANLSKKRNRKKELCISE